MGAGCFGVGLGRAAEVGEFRGVDAREADVDLGSLLEGSMYIYSVVILFNGCEEVVYEHASTYRPILQFLPRSRNLLPRQPPPPG